MTQQQTLSERVKRDTPLSFKIDADLKREIERAANAEDRSVSNWVIRALRRALDEDAKP